MKHTALIALCLLALAALSACGDYYEDLTYPQSRFDPGTH